jgi:hypothetical protein
VLLQVESQTKDARMTHGYPAEQHALWFQGSLAHSRVLCSRACHC